MTETAHQQLGELATPATPAGVAGVVGVVGEHPMAGQVRDFLADLEFAGKARHTIRAYRGDLAQLAEHVDPDRDVAGVDASVLRAWSTSLTAAGLAQSTRARKQAAVAAFLRWAVRHDLIEANPMDRFDRVAVPEGVPRPVDPARIDQVIAAIPKNKPSSTSGSQRCLRDRLLFEFLRATGCRVGEALGVYLEDLDLTPGNEHVLVHGKGGRVRILLLDDQQLVNLLRRFLRTTGWTRGPLFRSSRAGNWTGRPLTYSTVQELWAGYRTRATERAGEAGEAGAGDDELIELHQLRHTHATELTNDGVSPRTIQKRLGHRRLQTTLVYADHSDATVDAELRAWQRQRGQRGQRSQGQRSQPGGAGQGGFARVSR